MSDEAAAIAEPAQVQEPKAPKRITKVLKLEILKPAGEMKWAQLAKLLRDARYRVFRLANLAVSEAYPLLLVPDRPCVGIQGRVDQ